MYLHHQSFQRPNPAIDPSSRASYQTNRQPEPSPLHARHARLQHGRLVLGARLGCHIRLKLNVRALQSKAKVLPLSTTPPNSFPAAYPAYAPQTMVTGHFCHSRSLIGRTVSIQPPGANSVMALTSLAESAQHQPKHRKECQLQRQTLRPPEPSAQPAPSTWPHRLRTRR